jgi:hypothetical protein
LKIEKTLVDAHNVATIDSRDPGNINIEPKFEKVESEECEIVIDGNLTTEWIVRVNSDDGVPKVAEWPQLEFPDCNLKLEDGDDMKFKRENVIAKHFFNASIFFLVFKLVGWLIDMVSILWTVSRLQDLMKDQPRWEDIDDQTKREEFFKEKTIMQCCQNDCCCSGWNDMCKCLHFAYVVIRYCSHWLGYLVFTFLMAQVMQPLTSIIVHENCPHIVTMSYNTGLWDFSRDIAWLLGVVILSIPGAFMPGPFAPIFAMISCMLPLVIGLLLLFVIIYFIIMMMNVSLLTGLGVDFRHIFSLNWPGIGINDNAEAFRIMMLLSMLYDTVSLTIATTQQSMLGNAIGEIALIESLEMEWSEDEVLAAWDILLQEKELRDKRSLAAPV